MSKVESIRRERETDVREAEFADFAEKVRRYEATLYEIIADGFGGASGENLARKALDAITGRKQC